MSGGNGGPSAGNGGSSASTGGSTGNGNGSGGGGPSAGGASASGGAPGAGGAPGSGGAPGLGGASGSGGAGGSGGAAGSGGRLDAGADGTMVRVDAAAGSGGARVDASPGTGGASGADAASNNTAGPIGWASTNDLGQNGTTGGADAAPMVVTTLAALQSAASGTAARVIRISGSISGTVAVGSNKTIIGEAGAVFTGSLSLENSVNVIVQNLTVVGLNCTDFADCESGADAVTVNTAHHIWIDHCNISNGSDGNLDVTDRSDYVTISWNKFSYSNNTRIHRYSNIVGGSDTATADAGHLRLTFYNNWWADNVDQRQPRVRFGQVHVFNNLYTSTAASYCLGLGVEANVLMENNVFIGVRNPINSTEFSNAASVVVSRGNLYTNTSGTTADKGTAVFTPPYAYSAVPASAVEAAVRAGAGPH